jgi:hypothetical protein
MAKKWSRCPILVSRRDLPSASMFTIFHASGFSIILAIVEISKSAGRSLSFTALLTVRTELPVASAVLLITASSPLALK